MTARLMRRAKKFDAADVEAALAPLRARIAELEVENQRLKRA